VTADMLVNGRTRAGSPRQRGLLFACPPPRW